VWDYFFIPPILTFTINQPEDIIMCLTYFVVAAITGGMAYRVRKRETMIREREAQTALLYDVMQDISASSQKDEFWKRSQPGLVKC